MWHSKHEAGTFISESQIDTGIEVLNDCGNKSLIFRKNLESKNPTRSSAESGQDVNGNVDFKNKKKSCKFMCGMNLR